MSNLAQRPASPSPDQTFIWNGADQHEVRILLGEAFGFAGQSDFEKSGPTSFYLPLAGNACRVILKYRGDEVVSLSAGPAMEPLAWNALQTRIDDQLRHGQPKFGREFSFSGYSVLGAWRGRKSGVQIMPAPASAPIDPHGVGDRSFVLEFPLQASDYWPLTNYRRMRTHRQLTNLLNVLLTGRISAQPRRNGSFWATVGFDAGQIDTRWVTEGYQVPVGAPIFDAPSELGPGQIEELTPEEYAKIGGIDGLPFRVPKDLDDSICAYLALSKHDRARFDRAAFWMDLAYREWTYSVSSSFRSLVSAVEAMCDRGEQHSHKCPVCNADCRHEVPGATESFRAFFEEFTPGESERPRRSKMYQLRSGIVHGDALMQIDLENAFGFDPQSHGELELTRELWGLTQRALRNWLKTKRQR